MRIYDSIRLYLGAVAIALGCLGLFFLVLNIPLILFGAHFWGGFGFREGPQPTREQIDAAVSRELWWAVRHRVAPLALSSIALLCYGFYEAFKEQQKKM